ncbi:MAG TPA: hypothetical protein VKR55_15745, partial [Bradyrhizobium sp.]|uniref:hypothetical protein n=1 Tax=Bradyrhizobium sp. TaxID=376 RepID=UPI002D04BB17
ALASRLQPVCFDIRPADRKEVIARLLARYEQVLTENNLTYDPARLNEIVHTRFNDLRQVASQIEFEFGHLWCATYASGEGRSECVSGLGGFTAAFFELFAGAARAWAVAADFA